MKNNMNVGAMIGGITLTCLFIYNVYLFFEKTSFTANLLSVGASALLLFLIIPFWSQVIKVVKQQS